MYIQKMTDDHAIDMRRERKNDIMKTLFNYDGGIMNACRSIMYVSAANLLFLLCSLPIITVGASATAMYTVLARYQQHKEPLILHTFFTAFRKTSKSHDYMGWYVACTCYAGDQFRGPVFVRWDVRDGRKGCAEPDSDHVGCGVDVCVPDDGAV